MSHPYFIWKSVFPKKKFSPLVSSSSSSCSHQLVLSQFGQNHISSSGSSVIFTQVLKFNAITHIYIFTRKNQYWICRYSLINLFLHTHIEEVGKGKYILRVVTYILYKHLRSNPFPTYRNFLTPLQQMTFENFENNVANVELEQILIVTNFSFLP